jgi:hypothetical protein
LAILAFFTVSCGGIAVGAIFGLLTALITRTTQECRGVYPSLGYAEGPSCLLQKRSRDQDTQVNIYVS